MEGTDDKRTEPPSRWVTAARRASGVRDNGMGEALRTYYTRYFPVGAVLLLALGSGGSYLLFGDEQTAWQPHLEFGVILTSTGCLVGGLIYNAKRLKPKAELGTVSVLLSLNKPDQEWVKRQIAGKEEPDLEHLAVVRAAAVQMRKVHATWLLILPFYGYVIGTLERWWLVVPACALLFTGAVLLARDFRRQGRFLSRTDGFLSRTEGPG